MQSELPVRVARFIYRAHPCFTHPNEASPIFTNTPCVSRLRLSPRKPEAFLAEVTPCFTSAKNRYGFRADRLRPPACPPLYPDTAPTSRCRALWSAPMVTNYLGKPPVIAFGALLRKESSACNFRLVVAAALLSFLWSA